MTSLADSISEFQADVGLAHSIVNGDANTTVTTAGGSVRSFAKLQADNQTIINNVQTQANNASASAASAQSSASASATSAASAQTSATAAQNAANSVTPLNAELQLTTTGGTTTLTTAQAANGIYQVSGALASNAIILVPATPHNFTVQNLTTGPYTLTVQAQGQTPTAQVIQGKATAMFSDATGVYAVAATTGVQFAGQNTYNGAQTLGIAHLGTIVYQTAVGVTTTLPKANIFPAAAGVAIKNTSTGANSIAVQSGDTCELAVPYSLAQNDVFFLVSDGVSKWTVGWYANAENPVYSGKITTKSGGVQFPDSTVQTTANSTTQPASQWYAVGATDTVGSFANGDTALRTSGFTSPFVTVWKNGLKLTRGQHYTLNADNVHINLTAALTSTDTLEVQTQGVYNPSSTYLPSMPAFVPTAGATTIAYAHTVGFAWLMLSGVFLQPGVDYTEDATAFYLQGFSADGVETYTVFNLNAIGIANALAAANPVITSGPLQFADGSQQGLAAPGRNKLINGNFDLWQRGTSLAAAAGYYYLADRWQSISVGTTIAPSQQAFTLGQTAVPGEPRYFHRSVVASVAAAGNYALLIQRIEGVRTLAGQQGVLSFWAKADASKNISVEMVQNFGTGGSPSATVNGIGVTTCALTANWQQFKVPVTLPSIAANQIGTNGDDSLGMFFWFDAGSSFNALTNSLGQQSGTFDIARVQFEPGAVATPFEVRPLGTELALAQRYCVVYGPSTFVGTGVVMGNTQAYITFGTPVPMRATPTVSNSGTVSLYTAATSISVTSFSTVYGNLPVSASVNVASGMTAGQAASLFTNANTITLNAEL